jgi:hypothetical protein
MGSSDIWNSSLFLKDGFIIPTFGIQGIFQFQIFFGRDISKSSKFCVPSSCMELAQNKHTRIKCTPPMHISLLLVHYKLVGAKKDTTLIEI